jgi:hypothetical protein
MKEMVDNQKLEQPTYLICEAITWVLKQDTSSVHSYLYEHLAEARDGMGPGPHCPSAHHLKTVHSMWLTGVTPWCARAHAETCEAYKIVMCHSAIQEVHEK